MTTDFSGKTTADPEFRSPAPRTTGWAVAAASVVGLGLVLALVWVFSGRSAGNADQVWERAEEDFQANRWDEAEEATRTLATLRKPTPRDLLLRAQIAMARNRPDEALVNLAAIPDSDRLAAQSRLLSGQLELRRRKMRAAEASFRRALELDPSLIKARKELIYLYGMQIRRLDLAEQFVELGKLMPLDYDMVRLWCLTRGSVWEPSSHQKELKLILDADPEDARSRLALGEMLQQQGLGKEAEEALAPLPRDLPDVVAIRARVAFDQGNVDAARELLANGPRDHPVLARLRGRLDLLSRDPRAAIRDFEAAERLDPGQRDSLYGLGHAYRLLGDEAKAAPYFKSAQALDRLFTLLAGAGTALARADKTLPRRLADACAAAGRYPEARAWLKLILVRDPFDESTQRELFRIDEEEAAAKGK